MSLKGNAPAAGGAGGPLTWVHQLLIALVIVFVGLHLFVLYKKEAARLAEAAPAVPPLSPDLQAGTFQAEALGSANTTVVPQGSLGGLEKAGLPGQDTSGAEETGGSRSDAAGAGPGSIQGAEEEKAVLAPPLLGQGDAGGGGAAAAAAAQGASSSHPSANSFFLYMPPSAPIPDTCMAEFLRGAEESYQRNLARRGPLPDFGAAAAPAEVVSRILMPPYPCVLEQRIGMGGEGGKYVCRGFMGAEDLEARGPTVISVGSRGQTSFEEDANFLFGSISATFDPFLELFEAELLRAKPFLIFRERGLLGAKELLRWQREQREGFQRMVNLEQLLSMVGTRQVDILKIDCEKCEFGVVEDLDRLILAGRLPKDPPVFGQIAIEVHGAQQAFQGSLLPLLMRLEALGYRLFHVEDNPYWRWEGFEMSYIHESLVKPPTGVVPLSDEEKSKCDELLYSRASAIFEAHWRRKGWLFERKEVPMRLSWFNLMSVMMVTDYPCAQQERFGEWDKGPAWVCLKHRRQCDPQPATAVVSIRDKVQTSASIAFELSLVSFLPAGVARVFGPVFVEPSEILGSDGVLAKSIILQGAMVVAQKRDSGPAGSGGTVSLTELLSLSKVSRIFLLRVDCGGCEYELVEAMAAAFSKDTVPFAQIALAAHRWEANMALMMRLRSLGYRQFHAEEIGAEPSTVELSFIHEGCV